MILRLIMFWFQIVSTSESFEFATRYRNKVCLNYDVEQIRFINNYV